MKTVMQTAIESAKTRLVAMLKVNDEEKRPTRGAE